MHTSLFHSLLAVRKEKVMKLCEGFSGLYLEVVFVTSSHILSVREDHRDKLNSNLQSTPRKRQEIQLTLKQHACELHRPIYTQVFFPL